MAEKEITFEIKTPEIIVLIIFLSAIFIMELQVTLSTPISFGDEAFHTRMSQWIGENVEYPVWRPFEGSDIDKSAFDRPPLWNLLEGSFVFLIGYHEFIIKILTPFIAVLSGLVLFTLTKRLYNERVGFLASVIFVTIPSFVTYSVLFYADVLFTFYFTMFFLTFLLSLKNYDKKYWLLSAAFGGLAFLTKLPAIVVFAFIGLVFIYELMRNIKKANASKIIKMYTVFIVLTIVICSGFFIRSLVYYGTPHCGLPIPFFSASCKIYKVEKQYSFAGRTEAAGTEVGILAMGLTNYLNFAYGNIWFVIFGGLSGLIFMLMRGGRTDFAILLMLLLMVSILYRSSIRAEDTARHTLGWTPIIAIVVAKYFGGAYEFLKKYQKHLALVVFVFVLAIGYQNMAGKLNVMVQVKQFSPSFFEACDWVKGNLPKDSLLFTVWSHRATYSCQRNVIGNFADISLSRDLNHTLSVAKQHSITHIFIQKFSIDYQNRHFSEKYDLGFVEFMESNPENFNKVYENGPSLDQCRQQGGCDGNIIYQVVW